MSRSTPSMRGSLALHLRFMKVVALESISAFQRGLKNVDFKKDLIITPAIELADLSASAPKSLVLNEIGRMGLLMPPPPPKKGLIQEGHLKHFVHGGGHDKSPPRMSSLQRSSPRRHEEYHKQRDARDKDYKHIFVKNPKAIVAMGKGVSEVRLPRERKRVKDGGKKDPVLSFSEGDAAHVRLPHEDALERYVEIHWLAVRNCYVASLKGKSDAKQTLMVDVDVDPRKGTSRPTHVGNIVLDKK
ncbi:hypothetical protein CRG98_016838 [Punica granatum]|uniref:Uncharacterized protein n=1 Tax=Punica granatum TaxID=22663 RepID=A0A2I0K3R1_PUNGR|nr:hypothetical protein CRG98_016838 [Punica granatum]